MVAEAFDRTVPAASSMVWTVCRAAFSTAALSWFFEALRFKVLVEAAGERISFKMGLYLTFLNYFGSAITPMQGGRTFSGLCAL